MVSMRERAESLGASARLARRQRLARLGYFPLAGPPRAGSAARRDLHAVKVLLVDDQDLSGPGLRGILRQASSASTWSASAPTAS